MPILLVDENLTDFSLDNLRSIPIYSPSGKVYPLEQVTERFDFEYRYGVVKRYNRERVMMAQCDPVRGANTKRAFAEVFSRIESEVRLPEGYTMKVFGEQQSQEDSNAALAEGMPLTLLLIFATLLLLFRSYKKPVVILLMVPLIFIGVVLGLWVTGKQFDFFAMLGLLGLVGMNVKNAIVLVDRIGDESAGGKSPYEAVVSATRSENRSRADGFRDDDSGHAAVAVRLDVRRHGGNDHGRAARRIAAYDSRPAGRLLHILPHTVPESGRTAGVRSRIPSIPKRMKS